MFAGREILAAYIRSFNEIPEGSLIPERRCPNYHNKLYLQKDHKALATFRLNMKSSYNHLRSGLPGVYHSIIGQKVMRYIYYGNGRWPRIISKTVGLNAPTVILLSRQLMSTQCQVYYHSTSWLQKSWRLERPSPLLVEANVSPPPNKMKANVQTPNKIHERSK